MAASESMILLNVAMREASRQAVGEAAVTLQNIWKDVLNQTGRGERVVRYRPRRTHTASRPGDPPAPDTSVLRNSISIAQDESSGGMAYRVGPAGPPGRYARALEYGVPSQNLAPRPHARPARALAEAAMTGSVKSALQAATIRGRGSRGKRAI